MTDKNTLGKIEYIFYNVLWAIVAMAWYRALLFVRLDGFTASASKKILWTMIALFILIGIVLTFNRRRNCISTAVNILIPFQFYAVLSAKFFIWMMFLLLLPSTRLLNWQKAMMSPIPWLLSTACSVAL